VAPNVGHDIEDLHAETAQDSGMAHAVNNEYSWLHNLSIVYITLSWLCCVTRRKPQTPGSVVWLVL